MPWLGSITLPEDEVRWAAQLKMLASVAVCEVEQPLSVFRCCSRALRTPAGIRQLTCIQLQREQAGGCSSGCVRALQLPWEHWEILHRDKYLVIWGLDGRMAVPATQCPRPLNGYRRRVIIERGRCFLINYVNSAAAQPSCIFSNIISFVAQLLSVLRATADLKKLQFYSVVASHLEQTTL